MTTILGAGTRFLSTAIVLLAGFVLAAPVLAGSGGVTTLPLPGVKMKNSLRIQVDSRWVDANGYRPLKIAVTPMPPGPAPADRQIRVEIRPYDYSGGVGQRVCSKIIEIPQGATVVDTTIPIPQDSMWYSLGIDVYEGGYKLKDLSVNNIGLPRTNYWNWTEASPAVLVIDSDVPVGPQRDVLISKFKGSGQDTNPTHLLPDLRNLMRIFPENQFSGQMLTAAESKSSSDVTLLSQLSDITRAEMLAPEELPTAWLELSSFDLAFITLADLKELKQKHPKRFQALRDWLATGTTLCVYDVGKDFVRLAELEQLLALPAARLAPAKSPPTSDDEPTKELAQPAQPQPKPKAEHRGWTPADPQEYDVDLVGYDPTSAYQYQNGSQAMMQANSTEGAPAGSLSPPAETPFVGRSAGLGYVIAIADENPFPGTRMDWIWLLNSVPADHWMWYKRHGMSLHRTNDDFWSFLVPGVGMAPVVSFVLLISLFAVFIGPVNYWVLSRARRLYLLLLTVPIGAAVVTIALFAYALLTDGLGGRARVRSFTDIDQRTGRVASWSRQSYYASIAPSRGMTFPDDAAVFRLLHQPTSRMTSQRNSGSSLLEWDEDGQHLRRGFLSSRTAAQFMVVRAGQTESHLQVTPGKEPQVTNELGAAIQYVVLRDADGKYFAGESLAERAAAKLVATPLKDCQGKLKGFAKDVAPALPPGYDPAGHENLVTWMMPDYRRFGSIDRSASGPAVATGVLEMNLAPLSYSQAELLAPGTYLAIVDSPPDVPLGIPAVRQKASLHVIRGRY
jgi:hypothetical protein